MTNGVGIPIKDNTNTKYSRKPERLDKGTEEMLSYIGTWECVRSIME